MTRDFLHNPVNMVFQVGGTLRSFAWTTLEVKPGKTNGTKRLAGTSLGIWRKMKKRRMLQIQADCSSETFHIPALKKSSKRSSPNMVRREPLGGFAKKYFALLICYFFKGPLSEVHFPIDSLTKKTKGFAFITYMIPENAVAALAQLDGHIFQVTVT